MKNIVRDTYMREQKFKLWEHQRKKNQDLVTRKTSIRI